MSMACGVAVFPATDPRTRSERLVVLTGTRALLPDDSLRPHQSALSVLADEPLTARNHQDSCQAAPQLRDAARRQIMAQLGQPDAADKGAADWIKV